MDLRQLQALVAIADHGSFSAAASALHTVQSNVSSHVARLEKELGVLLVDRHAGQLTEEGQAVVERARRIAGELDAIVADVAALSHDVSGPVRIGIIATTARWLTPKLLERLSAVHPNVHLVVGEGTSSMLEPQLASGVLDVAVVNLPRTAPDLAERPLFDEDLILVVPPDHPLAGRGRVELADLDGLELLLPAGGSTFRQELDDAASEAGARLVPRAELDGLRLMASLTARGMGPSILPATTAAEGLDGFARLTVGGLPRRRIGAVIRRRGRPSAPARALLEILDRVVAEQIHTAYGIHDPATPAHDGQRSGVG
ncbi:MAG TPA: LysR family transcriptional regulator [Acidimicrobiales bacterium]|nr:LysR family transcriptional regulator [Acidimicrobiales bacterium]